MEAWFNIDGFWFDDGNQHRGKREFEYTDHLVKYDAGWFVAQVLFDTLKDLQPNGKIVVYNDSRIVEELNGKIEPETMYARRVYQYLKTNIFPLFSWLEIKKATKEKINEKISQDVAL